MQTISVEELASSHMQFVIHADGSDRNGRFFLNIYQSIEHPRLGLWVKHARNGQMTKTYVVIVADGSTEKFEALEAAALALSNAEQAAGIASPSRATAGML